MVGRWLDLSGRRGRCGQNAPPRVRSAIANDCVAFGPTAPPHVQMSTHTLHTTVSVTTRPPGESAPQGAMRASGTVGRIGRGFAANLAGNGVTVLIQLVSVPVFLAKWGVPRYGEWLILSAVPTYLALSDLSFSSVAGNSMVMLEAQGKRAAAIDLGRRLWSLVTVMTAAAVLSAVIIALLFGGAFGRDTVIPELEVRVVLVALFLQVAVGNQYGVLDAWYRTGGSYPLGATMRQVGRLIEFGALMVTVLAGATPGPAAIAFLIGSSAGFVVSWVVLRRAVPWSSFRLERPHLRTFRALFAPGVAFMVFPMGNALSLQGFTIVVGATMGAAAIVVFSTTRTVTRVALQVMNSINASILPELSRSVGGGHLAEARTIIRGAVQAAFAVSLSLVVVLAIFGTRLIKWWTHGLVNPPTVLLYILLLEMIASTFWFTLSAVVGATNRHKLLAFIYLLATILALCAAIPLSLAFGLVGAATALLAIDALMIAFTIPLSLRVVQDAPTDFLRALLAVPPGIRALKPGPRSRP